MQNQAWGPRETQETRITKQTRPLCTRFGKEPPDRISVRSRKYQWM